jgi:hypothetical protein
MQHFGERERGVKLSTTHLSPTLAEDLADEVSGVSCGVNGRRLGRSSALEFPAGNLDGAVSKWFVSN